MSTLHQGEVPQRVPLVAHAGLPRGVSDSESASSPPMNTSLRGRIRNTRLPQKQILMPLFEAVINSIHAIEDSGHSSSEGEISVFIHRVPQQDLGVECPRRITDVVGLTIEDNGIGFDNDNFESFRTLDTEHKVERGGRGVGRLLWIKCFEKVSLDSVFVEDGKKIQRTFSFDAQSEIHDHKKFPLTEYRTPRTVVKIENIRKSYRSNWHKSTEFILDHMLDHFLWYFLRKEGCPKIVVHDNGSRFRLRERFSERVQDSILHDNISIKGQEFSVIHVRLRHNIASDHFVALCADGRLVEDSRTKGKIPGLFEYVEDSKGPFVHGSYVTSSFLDDHVQPDREGFDILEEHDLFVDTEVTRIELMSRIHDLIKAQLSDIIADSTEKSGDRIHQFVCDNPNYKPILKHLLEQDKIVDPSMSDTDLELYLHKKQQDFEHSLMGDGKKILCVNDGEPFEKYEQRVQGYIEKISDLNKSALAKYVSHRRVVIEFLADAIGSPDGQRYSKEDLIHKLIMPMGLDSKEVSEANANLWLIDERLAFHDYLASDKSLASQPITESTSNRRPDIDALRFIDKPILVSDRQEGPFPSLTIIEFKRPMRQRGGDPLDQVLGYLDQIRGGTVKTSRGRPIPNAEHIMAYCYVIADLTEDVERSCKHRDLTPMHDGTGYFGYHKNYMCSVAVISYDGLVTDARERNHAFFAKLGLPLA